MLNGPSWKDDDYYVINHLLPKYASLDLGSEQFQWRDLWISGTIRGSGGFTINLPNNTYLEAANAAGSGVVDMLKADATDNTVVNALTGKQIKFAVNGTTVGTADSNSIDFPAFNLSDGSDKNYTLAVYAAGTAYSLTNTAAALDFGTTDPALTLNKAGTYLIFGKANLKYNGATFAAPQAVTIKLRRTNNTAADLTNGSVVLTTAIITTQTYTFAAVDIPPVLYTTSATDDAITIFGDVAVVPGAGSLDAIAASIVAVRLY